MSCRKPWSTTTTTRGNTLKCRSRICSPTRHETESISTRSSSICSTCKTRSFSATCTNLFRNCRKIVNNQRQSSTTRSAKPSSRISARTSASRSRATKRYCISRSLTRTTRSRADRTPRSNTTLPKSSKRLRELSSPRRPS